MLSIQTQLNTLTTQLENIFKEMQQECDKTFAEKPKDSVANEDGSMTVKGSREFIKQLQDQMYGSKNPIYKTVDGEKIDITTGEIIANV